MFATIKLNAVRTANYLMFNYMFFDLMRPMSVLINVAVAVLIVHVLATIGITGFIGALLGSFINIMLKRAIFIFCATRSSSVYA